MRHFPCGIPDQWWKSTCSLPAHSRCLTCPRFTYPPSSPPIHSQSLSNVSSPMAGPYILLMPQGFHFSSGTIYGSCCHISVLWLSITLNWGATLSLFNSKTEKLCSSFVILFYWIAFWKNTYARNRFLGDETILGHSFCNSPQLFFPVIN